MPLVLSLKDNEILYIDNIPYLVCDFQDDHFYIENIMTNDMYKVEATKMVEVHPEVKVSAGRFNNYKSVRLVVEAPKSIAITRKERRDANTKDDKG